MKHWHDKNNQRLWDDFRVKKNNYVKQSRISASNYFKEKYSDGELSRPFWQTVRPYMSDKGENHHKILLCKDDKIVSNPGTVANIFNNYFITATDGIGITEVINGLSIPKSLKNTEVIQASLG